MLDERALLTLLDEPAPPSAVTLDQVLRKGRHRVRMRRLGVVAMTFVMVAVVAGGGFWLRSVSASQSGDSVANGPMMRIDLPPWPENLAGWSLVTQAECAPVHDSPGGGPIPARDVVEPEFVSAVSYTYKSDVTVDQAQWTNTSGFLMSEVHMEGGVGSVQLAVSRTQTGTPVQLANADVNAYGTCAAPMRKVLDTGTVMQLYAPDTRSPHAPIQHVRTYLPNGLEYSVTSAGWSLADISPAAGDDLRIVSSGRGKLPLSSQELVDIADHLVRLE